MPVVVTSDRTKHLMVEYENQSNLLWRGLSGYQLDSLSPKSSLSIDMSLLPTSPGLQVSYIFTPAGMK